MDKSQSVAPVKREIKLVSPNGEMKRNISYNINTIKEHTQTVTDFTSMVSSYYNQNQVREKQATNYLRKAADECKTIPMILEMKVLLSGFNSLNFDSTKRSFRVSKNFFLLLGSEVSYHLSIIYITTGKNKW